MARTRAQEHKDTNGKAPPKPKYTPEGSRAQGRTKASAKVHHITSETQKRKREEGNSTEKNAEESEAEKHHTPKRAKTGHASHGDGTYLASGIDNTKLDALLKDYGVLPLQDLALVDSSKATPETLLTLVYLAMLTSARISHELAYKSLQCLVEAGYHDISMLSKSTWQERTEVLTKGGYTRYREKTAAALGELAVFVEKEYDGDLNNLLKRADSSPDKVRSLLQEIKGIGKVGSDIFFDAVQYVWPSLAPFIDPRSMETAKRCGIGSNLTSMWEAVGKDPVQMCRLSSALTMVRLEKREKEFQ